MEIRNSWFKILFENLKFYWIFILVKILNIHWYWILLKVYFQVLKSLYNFVGPFRYLNEADFFKNIEKRSIISLTTYFVNSKLSSASRLFCTESSKIQFVVLARKNGKEGTRVPRKILSFELSLQWLVQPLWVQTNQNCCYQRE